ncbi:MAG: carbohydrate ABC transporter permease [Devosia sp.]|jgi:glucose/mannose transport system permease protein|nr:carbohydrate ABC transporter permease [Devosiaceae bacterium]
MSSSAVAADTVFDAEAANARRRWITARVIIYGLLTLFSLIYIMPLIVVILNSFRDLPEINHNGLIAWPRSFNPIYWYQAWDTYCVGGTCAGVKGNFFNSLAMTIPATIISTALGAINGYILSKWKFRGSEIIFTCMLLGVFVPGQLSLMPWAYLLGKLHLTNTVYGLILLHCVQGLSFTTLFCRNFYVNIPDDLIKAARIDGAGFWRIFWKVILPISPPILIVTVIWQFTGIWNEFLFGVIFTSGTQQPITAALVALGANGLSVHAYNVSSAAVLIGAFPPLLVYFLGGKYFVRGLTQGAIK